MEKKISQQIDLTSLLRDVISQWLTIVLFSVAIGLFSYVWISMHYTPDYTTKATIIVTNRSTSSSIYQNQYSAEELAKTLTTVMQSNLMKKTVMDDLNLDQFNAETSATQIGSTNMIELQVDADSPYHAYAILKSILENYSEVSDYLVGSFIMEVISEPTVPYIPSNTKSVTKPAIRYALLAAILMIMALGFLSFSRDTVKNEEQLKEKIDTKCLGVIYHERKSNKVYHLWITRMLAPLLDSIGTSKKEQNEVSMLINNPMRNFFFVEANKILASRVRSRMDRAEAQVLLVTSVMENEGKSTVAANIALGIASEGNKVLLIDGDFRKPSQHKIFQVDSEMKVNLVDALENPAEAEELAQQYRDTGLYLIANYKHVRISDTDFRTRNLRKIIERFRKTMDYIILDTSPMALVTDTEELAGMAESSLLVIREDVVLTPHINDAIDTLNRVGCEVIGCAFNNATRKTLPGGNGYGYGYGDYRKGYGGYYGKYKK